MRSRDPRPGAPCARPWEEATLAEDLVINDHIRVPAGELRLSFARSSGPGGQNVNKVNSKAQLRWCVAESAALPGPVRDRLLARCATRINEAGELAIDSDRHREQGRNANDCRERLRALILAALTPARRRVATRPTKASRERRLVSKQRRGDIKRGRRDAREE